MKTLTDKIIRLIKNKNGLEISGPSKIFKDDGIIPIYSAASNIDDCSFPRPMEWRGRKLVEGKSYNYHKEKPNGKQYIQDATRLKKIKSNKYDFILASHVLEHIANPLKALTEWKRVIKNGGYLLSVVPHKDETFDHKRPVTLLEHIIEDYRNDITEDDLTHISEIIKLTDIDRDDTVPDMESLKKRAACNTQHRYLHHHVFDTRSLASLCDYCKLKIVLINHMLPFHIVILCRKNIKDLHINNAPFLKDDAEYKFTSPFRSDK